jgi:hypothetical protein
VIDRSMPPCPPTQASDPACAGSESQVSDADAEISEVYAEVGGIAVT